MRRLSVSWELDLAVSPREVMAKQVLSYLNRGPVVTRSHIMGSMVSVLELEVVDGTLATQQVLAELNLPSQSLIAAVSWTCMCTFLARTIG